MFTRRNKIYPFILIIFVTVFALTCKDVIAGGPSSDVKYNFEELMTVKWLACSLGPVETDSGEILDGIGFDPREKRTRVITQPPDKSWIVEDTTKDREFGKPIILVFDTNKSQVQLVYPSNLFNYFPIRNATVTSVINVQDVAWLTPGALQLTITKGDHKTSMVLNLVIFPGKIGEEFRALANFTYSGLLFVMSAQCSDNIDEKILPDVKAIHMELEAVGADSKEN